MNLTLLGALLVLVVAVMAIWGKKIVGVLFKDVIVKRYALKAVQAAEFLVEAAGEVKFKAALQWATGQIVGRWKLPIPQGVIAYWIDKAVEEMKKDGLEIKAEQVLPEEHPKILMRKQGIYVEINKPF